FYKNKHKMVYDVFWKEKIPQNWKAQGNKDEYYQEPIILTLGNEKKEFEWNLSVFHRSLFSIPLGSLDTDCIEYTIQFNPETKKTILLETENKSSRKVNTRSLIFRIIHFPKVKNANEAQGVEYRTSNLSQGIALEFREVEDGKAEPNQLH